MTFSHYNRVDNNTFYIILSFSAPFHGEGKVADYSLMLGIVWL